jgi:hypothetical protein
VLAYLRFHECSQRPRARRSAAAIQITSNPKTRRATSTLRDPVFTMVDAYVDWREVCVAFGRQVAVLDREEHAPELDSGVVQALRGAEPPTGVR